MPHKCSVFGCRSNYRTETEKTTVFSLPSDENRRNMWLRHIQTDFSKLKHPGVCIKHFDESCVIRVDKVIDKGELKIFQRVIPKLTDDAVPTIFPNIPSHNSKSVSKVKRRADVEEDNIKKSNQRGRLTRKKLRVCDDDEDNSDAVEHRTIERGRRTRKKLRVCDDEEDNRDAVEHRTIEDFRDMIMNAEIVLKQEVVFHPDDLDVPAQQECEYMLVKGEPVEHPDETICSAIEEEGDYVSVKEEPVEDSGESTDETFEQMGHSQELSLIIKEEIDCDDYIDPFSIPQEVDWRLT